MNYISDILYWISTGLLVPVIVLLIILFGRSVLLLGNFFGQYLAIRKTDALLRKELDALTPETVSELGGHLFGGCLHSPYYRDERQSGARAAPACRF